MPMQRISMNKVREIIRLNEQCNLSQRTIARALKISRPVVKEYIDKIHSSGLDYATINNIDDDTLLQIVEGTNKSNSDRYRALRSKFEYFLKELNRFSTVAKK
jgi:predicted transcriptional regulator